VRSRPLRIGVLVFDGTLGSEVFGFLDMALVARRITDVTGQRSGRPLVATVIGHRRRIRLAGGSKLEVASAEAASDEIDLLLVPGFEAASPDEIDDVIHGNRRVVEFVRTFAGSGRPVASICLGAFLLAESQVLDGRRVTTAWPFAAHLATRHPQLDVDPRQMIIRDGPFVTSAAFTAAHDLALDIVREHMGVEVARSTARVTLTSDARTAQAPYIEPHLLPTPRGTVSDQVKALVIGDPQRPWTLDDLAAAVHTSTRTLSRRFKAETGETPLSFVQRTRVSLARELLETTDQTLAAVMSAVGYQDPNAFRALFRSHTGLAPAEYRAHFRRPTPTQRNNVHLRQ